MSPSGLCPPDDAPILRGFPLQLCEIWTLLQRTTQEKFQPTSQTHHKEEAKARIQTDAKDRKALRDKLEVCIDPLNTENNQEGLVNIVTGQVLTHSSVNVDNAPELGEQQMEEFERGLPDSFHETIHRRVTTMAVSQKHIEVNDMKMFDTEMIYARAMALQCSLRNYDTKNLMAHELSPRPASMCDGSGAMKVAKTKFVLKNYLKVGLH